MDSAPVFNEPEEMARLVFDSPIGLLGVEANADAVLRISLRQAIREDHTGPAAANALCQETRRQVEAYLRGELETFDLPLEARGQDFQRRVWDLMSEIPFGTTRTYGEMARGLGQPGASQAVGNACGANPIPLLIPCHRVVASGGRLGGFGGGLDMKRWLLSLEARQPLLPF